MMNSNEKLEHQLNIEKEYAFLYQENKELKEANMRLFERGEELERKLKHVKPDDVS
jgi:hypothetical protein